MQGLLGGHVTVQVAKRSELHAFKAMSQRRVGMGCTVCERADCPQRAFPYVGMPLDTDENVSGFSPYRATGAAQNGAKDASLC